MDSIDLLFTNNFVRGDVPRDNRPLTTLEDKSNKLENNEEQDLKSFIQNELLRVNDNDDDDNNDDEKYNILDPPIRNPSLLDNVFEPEWVAGQQNVSLGRDVIPFFQNRNNIKDRYRKEIVSYLNVDSRYRDTVKYPNPADYQLFINKEYRNVVGIKLSSVEFKEAPTPINSTNNIFKWSTNYKGLEGVTEDTVVEYCTDIPKSFYILSSFVQTFEGTVNTIRHDLSGNAIDETFPDFRLTIGAFDRSINLIQRLESLKVKSISTEKNSNMLTIKISNEGDDPTGPPYDCDDDEFPFNPVIEQVPIILAGLNQFKLNFGGIPVVYLENIPFFPESASPEEAFNNNIYKCADATGAYEPIDKCFVYKLCVFDELDMPVNANITTETFLDSSNLTVFPSGHAIDVTVGRALKVTVDTECGSFGNFLGLLTENEEVYINTNVDLESGSVINKIAWKANESGDLLLATEEYVLMRLETPSKPLGTISDNLISAKGCMKNTEITINKKGNYFFAKIIFATENPGDVTDLHAGGDKHFYDAPLVSLTDLTIQFYDGSGTLLNLNQNHSFTLQITELQEVLRDTLIDSRTGNIANVGANVVNIAPV